MAFIQQIINGLSLGSIYALIALGYTMVYGIIKLINFAHGDIYMIGAFVGLYCGTTLKLSLIPTLLISMLGAALVGVIVEKVAYKPLRNSPRITLLITAIGVSLLLQNGMRLLMGPSPKAFPKLLSKEVIKIGALSIETSKILMLAVSIVLVLLLQIIVYKTKVGKAMRGASYDIEAASLMGINVNNIISLTFAIGSALAGAAGVLVSLAFTVVEPYMGIIPGLKAFIAAVLGGIGSIPGALVGGLLIGLTETLTKAYISTTLSDAIVFAILIIILLVKPTGLLGKKVNEKV
ncbi:branched-chain amino acid ABC transporter permease [Clostridium sp. NSJ-145]|uniref:branched-chain amino acid ABC transporter permease n=1 Tax=Clostridium sp. NSJ-145 TaxID=2897777 RepID=UPI001E47AE51|nr:branched-chain amino acid ABC transporter permease [Clostridium sp. NSJ-145]MCD2502921.1 branched-chain amino acid ABC transporter permease [Clostridium sp. NSJ-145]